MKKVKALVILLRNEFGDLPVMELSPSRVSLLQNRLVDNGLSPRTASHHLQIVKAVLNHSVLHERIPYNPVAKVKKLRTPKKHLEFWEEHEAQAFLAATDELFPSGTEQRYKHLVFLLALNTGMRAGEIWGLKVMDFNSPRRLIHVRRQFDRVMKGLRPTKGKTERLVPCSEVLWNELSKWIEQEGLVPEALIFKNQQGNAICHENFVKREFLPTLKKSGLRIIRFHDLRHTAATLMIAKGLNPALVQSILGHQSITTTMNYVHVLGRDLQRASEIFSVNPSNENSAQNEAPNPKVSVLYR